MLTREEFKKYMTQAKEMLDAADKIDEAFKLLSSSSDFYIDKPFNIIIDLLSTIMNDKYDYIGYFISELEWGERAEIDSITEEDGTPIPMFNLDDLYDRLKEIQETEDACTEK